MFFGTYTPRLDDKGRLFLPAKFRDELAEGLVVTRGQERCLYVWSMEELGETHRAAMRENAGDEQGGPGTTCACSSPGSPDETPDKQGSAPPALPPRRHRALDLFLDATTLTLTSIVARGSLVRNLSFPRIIVPMSATLTAAITFCVNLLVIVAFIAGNRLVPRVSWLLLIPLFLELSSSPSVSGFFSARSSCAFGTSRRCGSCSASCSSTARRSSSRSRSCRPGSSRFRSSTRSSRSCRTSAPC